MTDPTALAAIPIIPVPGFAEPFASISHLIIGTSVFAALTPFLFYHARGSWVRSTWLLIFTVAILFMLPMSGVYHLLEPGGYAREEVLRRLDHAAIFVLIAGTFTAGHGILFRGWWRWGVIGLLWGGVAIAIPLKMVYFDTIPELLSLALYLGFGWLGLVSGIKLWHTFGYQFIRPLLWGGVAYSVGAIMEFLRTPVLVPGIVGPHELFHVAVLIGLACHWWFIWEIAGAARRREIQLDPAEVEALIKQGVNLAQLLNFQVEATTRDSAVVRLPFRDVALRAGGTISGPIIMMLADTAMYALILATRGPELLAVTSSMTLNFLSRPPPGDLVGTARLLKMGKRLAVIEVEIRSVASDNVVAHVTGTYSLPPGGTTQS